MKTTLGHFAGPLTLLAATTAGLACEGKSKALAAAGNGAPAKAAPTARAPAPSTPPQGPLGRILPTSPLPIESMLGKPPPEVEVHLGEPLGKGMVRDSCVRHLPDRTWFKCSYVTQKYADKGGTFQGIGVQYEDGVAASMSWEPIPGDGPFDPLKAMAAVGLEIPGQPSRHEPAENVQLWSYFNSASRLRISDREYRVEVSVVDGSWAKSKVELILNDHLTDDEKARVFQTKGTNAPKNP